MNKKFVKTAAVCGLCLALLATGASAAYLLSNRMTDDEATDRRTTMFGNQQSGQMNGMIGEMRQGGRMQSGEAASTVSAATAIVSGTTTNSAASLTADYANATTVTMSDENSTVKVKAPGTYIVTGSCSDGSIIVTRGTTGVVLILRDLDLTSTTGATLSINKGAEAKIIVEGSVKLTDAENAADENSTDEAVADAFDGAAIKVKSGASAYLTGSGTLTVNGSAKNGIKVSANEEDGNGSLVIDGATVNITAANDGINAEYDLAILSGELTVSAGEDGIHADRILTIGSESTSPTVTITRSDEGIEATVVNLAGGTVNVTAGDDGVNAADRDGAYASEMACSINITGANVTVNSRADGLDSNGNVNLVSGSATISSANNGGDAGIDYDGSLYIADTFQLNNQSGVTSMGAMGGMMGGQMGGMNGMQQNGQQAQTGAPAQNRQSMMQNQFGGQALMGGMPGTRG